MAGGAPVATVGAAFDNIICTWSDGVWGDDDETSSCNIWRVFVKTLFAYISYVWATTLAGLAIHPYKSVKRMVLRERILLPVVLSPLMGLVALFVVGRVGSYVMNLEGLVREVAAFVLGVSLIGLLMWQILLLALVLRFWRAR